MSHTPAFSIIIPTYNVESYIARCLDSCINQTFSDIEIIVVDDCGSDTSVAIAKTYAKHDDRISILHNPKNLGLFQTRLTGEKVAKGTYILCLDADDYLAPTACATLYQTIHLHTPSKGLFKNPIRGAMVETKVSLIIPMHNVQAYIARCLESCINQSFSDIEILIIDDCGSDESVAIAREYAKRDLRIQILRNPRNLGTFASRLRGMQEARGAYVMFVDADDYLMPNACEQAYKTAQQGTNQSSTYENLPDIVHFKATYRGSTNASLLENLKHKARYILPTQWSAKPLRDSEIAYNFFLKSKHFPKFTLWDKCYKASLIKQALPYFEDIPTSLNMAEDMLKFFVLASLARSYVSVDSRLYVYCLNATSITQNPGAHTKKIRDMHHIIKALKNLSEEIRAPYAREIAHTMSDHLRALIVLESRFDKGCVNLTEGGGSTESIAVANVAQLTIFARLHRFSSILESLSDLHSHICIYPNLWAHKDLRQAPSTKSTHHRFVEVA